ncbi:MAG: hypothetical protein ACRDO7_05725 [Nocardioidaceae bacterium]
MTAATTSGLRRRTEPVWRRWPTALALVLTAPDFIVGTNSSDSAVGSFGQAFLLLPLLYLVIAKVGRRGVTWPVVFAGLLLMTALRVQDVVAPIVVIVAVSPPVLVWGAVERELHTPGPFRVQALGMAGFAVLAVAGLTVDVDLGRYLVAAAWFLHGVWDFVHLWKDRVVARSFAEWCGVIDVLVAAQLVLLA